MEEFTAFGVNFQHSTLLVHKEMHRGGVGRGHPWSRRPHEDTAVLKVVTLKPHAQGLNVTERQILTPDRVWRNSCGYFQEFMN